MPWNKDKRRESYHDGIVNVSDKVVLDNHQHFKQNEVMEVLCRTLSELITKWDEEHGKSNPSAKRSFDYEPSSLSVGSETLPTTEKL